MGETAAECGIGAIKRGGNGPAFGEEGRGRYGRRVDSSRLGNGKATAVLFAREGARVFAVDVNGKAAAETKSIIDREGGICEIYTADVSNGGGGQGGGPAVPGCLRSHRHPA